MNSDPLSHDDLSENPAAAYEAEALHLARRKAGTTLLVALGAGLLIGALVHALRPEPRPRQRLARLLEDMEDRLREASAPALNRADALATDGAHALGDGFSRSEAQVEKFIRSAARRLRRLAS